jgi:predicted dehydrogenase
MSRKNLSVLIVGMGSVFERAHLPLLEDVLDIKQISGVEPVLARQRFWKCFYPQITLYDNIDVALKKGNFDCAIVTTYPQGRAKLIKSLCEAKILRILCEKPLETTLEGLEVIKSLVVKHQLILIPCHNWAYSPVLKEVEKLSKKFISLPAKVRVKIQRTGPAQGAKEGNPFWRIIPQLSGGGILMDHGYHCLYLAQRWLSDQGLYPTKVRANIDRSGNDLSTKAKFISASGSQLELVLTWEGDKRYVSYKISSNGQFIKVDDGGVIVCNLSQNQHHVFSSNSLSENGIYKNWYKELYDIFFSSTSSADTRVSFLNQEAFTVNESLLNAYSIMKSNSDNLETTEEKKNERLR